VRCSRGLPKLKRRLRANSKRKIKKPNTPAPPRNPQPATRTDHSPNNTMDQPSGSYSPYSAALAYDGSDGNGSTNNGGGNGATLRRRNVDVTASAHASSTGPRPSPRTNVVKKLDFMFPKVDTEYTVTTERGGFASLVAYGLILLLITAETWSWMGQNKDTTEHIRVDTSLGKRMRVNVNVTFPALACEDLHVDVIDVAGDAQYVLS